MNTVIKAKWLVLLVWIISAVGLLFTAPDMQQLVRDKGQITLPEDTPSYLGSEILKEVNEQKGGGEGLQTALVFHKKDGLSKTDLQNIDAALHKLEKKSEQLGITTMINHVNQPDLKEQLVSKDGTTILSSLTLSANGRTAQEISGQLYNATEDVSIEHYFTGNWLVEEDVIVSAENGLKKTEIITVIFILAILFIVFRSAIAPFIPLLAVGFSYLIAQSVVAFLAEYADFPLSNFTQIFMVAVMFGIGTDYCILLISRFKEELGHAKDIPSAIVQTYKTAGKTVLFAALAVLVGFSTIGFSKFSLYQSAAAVAVGIAVLILGLLTLVPFFMAVLGRKLFWPSKGSLEHKQSAIWNKVGTFSLKRSLLSLLIVAAIVAPALITYDGDLSFNSMEELGEDYDSVKGFNLIADAFGPGESMTTKVVIKNDEKLDHVEGLALVEQISRELQKVEGVQTVRSATRPTGEAIDDLKVGNQVQTLHEGLEQISSGLANASQQLSRSAPELKQALDVYISQQTAKL